MKLTEMEEEIQEKYSVKNRVNYFHILPGAEEILQEYSNWEHSLEGEIREIVYKYRKSGELALTWGWFMEMLQKEWEYGLEEIEKTILKLTSPILQRNLKENQDLYRKMLTTIIFVVFVYPGMKNFGELRDGQRRILERVYKLFPGMIDDICEYPGITSRIQSCKYIPYHFMIYCLKKWKADGNKEEEIAEFIKGAQFFKEVFEGKKCVKEHKEYFPELLTFMEVYTEGKKKWQESYAYLLVHRIQQRDIEIMDEIHLVSKNKEKEYTQCLKEQAEKLNHKGIRLLEVFIEYCTGEDYRCYQGLHKMKFFLALNKEKEKILSGDSFEKFLLKFKGEMEEYFYLLLDQCRFEIPDKKKCYVFQSVICLVCNEEEIVGYIRKQIMPPEMIGEVIGKLRKIKKIDKIPLLLSWMYREEEAEHRYYKL